MFVDYTVQEEGLLGLYGEVMQVFHGLKINTRDIATVIGFAIGGPAGAAIGQGIGSLGEGRDFKDSVMSAGKVYAGASMAQGAGLQGGQSGAGGDGFGISFGDPITGSGGIGGFFEDVGATGRDMFSGAEGTKFGSGDVMGSFDNLNALQKAGVLGIGASALSGGEDAPAEMPGPIDQSGYLQRGLTPAVLSDVYGTSGGGASGSMPSLASSYDYDPVNSSLEEFLRKQQEYELDFPEFERVQVNDGGKVARLADGGEIPKEDLDLREDGGDISDPEGSGDEDTVPALLADGEFVVTKQAVSGIGDGDHELGIAQLYDMMNMNEDKAQSMGIGRA